MAALSSINLFVKDVEQATQFYREVIGLAVNAERSAPPGFVLFEAGGATLTLQDETTPGAIIGPSDSVEIGFSVNDVAAVRQKLLAFGVEVGEPEQMGWGDALSARDPDGHRLNLFKMR